MSNLPFIYDKTMQGMMLRLWFNEKLDTLQIAKRICEPEAAVYNTLAIIKKPGPASTQSCK